MARGAASVARRGYREIGRPALHAGWRPRQGPASSSPAGRGAAADLNAATRRAAADLARAPLELELPTLGPRIGASLPPMQRSPRRQTEAREPNPGPDNRTNQGKRTDALYAIAWETANFFSRRPKAGGAGGLRRKPEACGRGGKRTYAGGRGRGQGRRRAIARTAQVASSTGSGLYIKPSATPCG